MTSILSSEDLGNIKHTVLTIERQEIARNIEPSRFFGHLRAKYIFDERDCDEIRSVSSRVGSAEVFVDTLKRKGSRGYDEFCNALMSDKTQMFLLQRLTQTLELLRVKVIERKNLKLEQLQKASSFQHPSIHQMDSLPHSLPHSSHTGSIPTGDTHPAASMQPHPQSVIPPSSQQLHTTNSLPSNTQFNGMHHQLTAVGPSGKPSSVQFTQLPQQTGPANYQGNLLPGQQRHYSSLSDQYVHNPNTYSHKKIQSRQTAGKQFVQPESIHNTPTSRGNNTLLSPTQCQSMYNRSHGQEEILLDHTQQSAPPHCIPQGMNPPQVYSPSHYQPLSPVRSPVAYEQPQTWQPQEQHHYGNNPVSPYRSIQHGGGVGNQQYISDVPLTSGCGQVMMLPDPEQPCGQIVLARSSN